jgi:hypothetical protein
MQGTPATATEISVRMQQLEALIGPTLGRLQIDLLQPLILRTLGILFREGRLAEMPEIVRNSGGAFEIEYTSPIAKTQEASSAASIERWVATVIGIAQANPEVLDVPDWDGVIKALAGMQGVSQILIKAQDQIDSERQQRQAQQQQMAEGEAMQSMGKGMQEMEAAQGGMQ